MRKWKMAAIAALLAALAGGAASGQGYPDQGQGYPDQDYPDSYNDDLPVPQTVARLSYIYGDVSFARGDDPEDWQPADSNVPMTIGDRAWTADGRLELQIHGGNMVRLARRTVLTALNMTEDTKQFSLSGGIASFAIRRLYDDEVFEVDTPSAAITFVSPGDYRIDVRQDGGTRIQVQRGRAVVAAGGGQIPIDAGEGLLIDDNPPRYDFIALSNPDGWDGFVRGREVRYQNVRSYQYVSPSIAGVEDLDAYGSWSRLPTYGYCWTPTSVSASWAPYRAGRWIWQDPWGWTWVSTERWGWAPYHYGRWVVVSRRWYWVPVAPTVAVISYRPALVAFVGGGPGFSVSVGVGAEYIGWFPLAPREPLIPWWGRPAVNVNITNITYVNRTYVTVVNQPTFVGSRVITNSYVRDASVIQRVERSPVLAGPIPFVPTRESIRVSTRSVRAARPPEAVVSRAVVARVAPPPAPPRFDEKVQVIRENRGAPVNPVESQRLAEQRGRVRPPVQVRPAAEQSGRVELVPRSEKDRAVRPEPVAAPAGRTLATRERPMAPINETTARTQRQRQSARPVAEAPARGATPGRVPEARQVPPAREAESQREANPRQAPQARPAPTAREVEREAAAPADTRPRQPTQRGEAPRPTAARGREVPPQNAPPERSAQSQSKRPTPRPPAQAQTPQNARERGEPATVDRSQPPAGSRERGEQVQPTPSSKGRDRSHPRPTPTPRD